MKNGVAYCHSDFLTGSMIAPLASWYLTMARATLSTLRRYWSRGRFSAVQGRAVRWKSWTVGVPVGRPPPSVSPASVMPVPEAPADPSDWSDPPVPVSPPLPPSPDGEPALAPAP